MSHDLWDVRINSDQGAMDMDLFRSTFIQKVRLINPKIEGVTKVSSLGQFSLVSEVSCLV